jgi:micrococcal nuclease
MSTSNDIQKELIKGVNNIQSLKRNKWKPFIIILIIITTSTLGYFAESSNQKSKNNKFSTKIEQIDLSRKYEVTKVVDGDTFDIKVDNQTVKVRMIGVDTPETVDPRKTVQCFGKQASDKTKELLLGHSVTLETDATQGVTDKFGRLLAYVYRDDGMLVNQYLIENGYAHEYTYNVPYQKQKDFKYSEKVARENKLGLWGSLCDQKSLTVKVKI